MRIDSTSSPTGRSAPPSSSDNVMARPAPAHVDNLRWSLANADERRTLLRQGPRGRRGKLRNRPSSGARRGQWQVP